MHYHDDAQKHNNVDYDQPMLSTKVKSENGSHYCLSIKTSAKYSSCMLIRYFVLLIDFYKSFSKYREFLLKIKCQYS